MDEDIILVAVSIIVFVTLVVFAVLLPAGVIVLYLGHGSVAGFTPTTRDAILALLVFVAIAMWSGQ